MKINITKVTGRALQRSNKRKLITQKILELAQNPDVLSANVIRMHGRTDFRMRVQDWRVIFHIEGDTLWIDEMEPRGSIYEDRS